jgi:hypothetical protein
VLIPYTPPACWCRGQDSNLVYALRMRSNRRLRTWQGSSLQHCHAFTQRMKFLRNNAHGGPCRPPLRGPPQIPRGQYDHGVFYGEVSVVCAPGGLTSLQQVQACQFWEVLSSGFGPLRHLPHSQSFPTIRSCRRAECTRTSRPFLDRHGICGRASQALHLSPRHR